MVTLTSGEAQNKFGQLLDTAQRETVEITRHGRSVAFVISPAEMEELANAKRKKAVAALDAWRVEALRHMTTAAEDLTDEEINRLVHKLR